MKYKKNFYQTLRGHCDNGVSHASCIPSNYLFDSSMSIDDSEIQKMISEANKVLQSTHLDTELLSNNIIVNCGSNDCNGINSNYAPAYIATESILTF